MPREVQLSKTFVELADTLVDEFDVVDLLSLLSDRCVEVLEVEAAGIMLATPSGELQTLASSSHAAHVVELFQLQSEEGPCLDCYREGRPMVNVNLVAGDGRWPRFATQALAAGFRSVHSLPMHVRGATIGALNLFHSEVGELPASDIEAAQALADVATIAIFQHRATQQSQLLNQQLHEALNSRVVIEQAKGIVAEARRVDMDRAFASLRSHARNHNLRLGEVSRAVIDGSLAASALEVAPPPASRLIARPPL